MEDAMIDSERQALFARARRAASPGANDRMEVRAAIARRLAVTAGAAVATTAIQAAATATTTAKAAGAVGTGLSLITKVLVSVVAIAAVTGGAALVRSTSGVPATSQARGVSASLASWSSPSSPRGAVAVVVTPGTEVTAPAEPPKAGTPVVQAMTSLGAGPPSTAASTSPAAIVPASTAAMSAKPSAEDPRAVAPETALMADIQSALRNGDAASVLVFVSEHERRYPQSAWAPEREGARVLARCSQAASVDTRALGQSFLALHPLSPLGGRVRATCGLDTPTQ